MKLIQKVMLVAQGDTTIDINEVPVIDGAETVSNQLCIINFLRCGCPAVQSTHNKCLRNNDPDGCFMRELESIQISLNTYARRGEKFTVEDVAIFQESDSYNEHHVIEIKRSMLK